MTFLPRALGAVGLVLARRPASGKALSLALAAALGLGALPGGGGSFAPAAGQSQTLTRPDASHGLQLQRLVEGWVQEGSIDGRLGEPLPAAGVLGVRVTLRSDGFHQGTGTAWVRPEVLRPRLGALLSADPLAAATPADEPRPGDLRRLAQEAAVDAFRATEVSLKRAADEAREAGRLPRLLGAREVATIAELGQRLQVDVQIAHAAEVVRAPALGDPGAGPTQRFVPGFHGLLGLPDPPQAEPAATWPATMLAYNVRPALQLGRVARGVGLGVAEADTLGRAGGPPLFRFEVVHAVRSGRGGPVHVLERGNLLVPRSRLDDATLTALGDRLASHLATHYPVAGPVRGTWRPDAGRYEPSLAALEEAAFGAYALADHDRQRAREAAAREQLGSLRMATRVPGWLQEIATALDAGGPETALGPDAAAQLTLAALAVNDGEAGPLARRFAAELALRSEGGVVDAGPVGRGGEAAERDRPVRVSRTTRAMVGYALGAYALAADDAASLGLSAGVLDGLWAEGDAAVLGTVFALPWIGRATAEVSPTLVQRGLLAPEEARRRLAAMRLVLPALQEAQIIRRPEGAPADTLGGFLLRPAPPGVVAEPDWTTAPLLQFFSQGILDFGPPDAAVADLDAPGRTGKLIAASLAARFLAQLSFTEASLFYARAPQNAVGGLRPSLDVSGLAIGPTAAALLAVNELQAALGALSKRSGPAEAETSETGNQTETETEQPQPAAGEPAPEAP